MRLQKVKVILFGHFKEFKEFSSFVGNLKSMQMFAKFFKGAAIKLRIEWVCFPP